MKKSTIDQPIYFFEVYLNESGINSLKQDFYNSYVEGDNNSCTIDYEDESVTYYSNAIGENGEYIDGWHTDYFKARLERQLRGEFEKSKQLIDEKIIQLKINQNDINNFLDWQLKILINKKNESQLLFKKYPICYRPINGLINYINRQVNIDKIRPIETSFEENPILEIFGFLKEYNDNGQKIMSDSDYNRLIDAIEVMIKKKFAPQIEIIPKLHIPTDLLRYCFYCLHRKEYGIKPQRTYVLDFMKNNLEQFNDVEYDVLKSNFASKPYSKNKNYIPLVIKSTL